jgi:aspartokinase
MKILIDEKNLPKLQKLVSNEKIIKIDKKLAEINIHFEEEASKKVGIIGIITNELAINSVNVVEIISCSPEVLFFVHEKDLATAHQVIYRLCHE